MIGLDTNILVRYLVQDSPSQAKKATQIIENAALHGETLYLNHVVMSELCWVLVRAYKFSRPLLVQTLESILSTKQFEIEDKDIVFRALCDYRGGKADFPDCLIGFKNAHAGCAKTVSLDKGTKTLSNFKFIG